MSAHTKKPIPVSRDVYDGIFAARESGIYNMFQWQHVVDWLEIHGYESAAEWVLDNTTEYIRGIRNGFAVVGENHE